MNLQLTAVRALHDINYIYRDIKPHNLCTSYSMGQVDDNGKPLMVLKVMVLAKCPTVQNADDRLWHGTSMAVHQRCDGHGASVLLGRRRYDQVQFDARSRTQSWID